MQSEAPIAGNRNGINKLHIGMLEGVNLADFPEGRTHYLAYALQFGLKLPSVKTMNRCERKNRAKAGADKADQITGKVIVPVVRRKKFNITTRYGDKEVDGFRGGFFRRGIRGRRNAKKGKQAKKNSSVGPKRVFPVRNSISLPSEIVKRDKVKFEQKERTKAFKIRSPQCIKQRAERQKFMAQIEQYRKNIMEPEGNVSPLPEYFRKRKENQKRRRQERRDLINDNKETLVNIFGDVVNQLGWPVGRRDIKLALGIDPDNDQDENNIEAFAELMEQAEKDKSKSKAKRAQSTNPKITQGIPESRPSKKVHLQSSKSKDRNNCNQSKKK